MLFSYHHLDKWAYANLDLIEEILESNSKAVVFIGGASSSGKSYGAKYLSSLLNNQNHSALVLSLDQYNKGLSSIIPSKVNENYFGHKLDEHMPKITSVTKRIIVDMPFEEKFNDTSITTITESLDFLDEDEKELLAKGLADEWSKLNFDEPSVYDLNFAASDIQRLCKNEIIDEISYSKVLSERVPSDKKLDGSKYDVIIIEGIYALNSGLREKFSPNQITTNFINGDPKTLFLRRILRDRKTTSCSTAFTTKLYFSKIVKAYEETILPDKKYADVILENDMSFAELRRGELIVSRQTINTSNHQAEKILKLCETENIKHLKDVYFKAKNETQKENNLLRLRSKINSDGTSQLVSMIHKGVCRARKDGKIVRPVNYLLVGNELSEVWKTEEACINDLKGASFEIEKVENKTVYFLKYLNQKLHLTVVNDEYSYVEFFPPISHELINKLTHLAITDGGDN